MNGQRFASVWDAIEDTPHEAENMKLREHLERTGMTQAQAGKLSERLRQRALRSTMPPHL